MNEVTTKQTKAAAVASIGGIGGSTLQEGQTQIIINGHLYFRILDTSPVRVLMVMANGDEFDVSEDNENRPYAEAVTFWQEKAATFPCYR